MTKYLNFFESESGFTEAVEAGQLFYPNVSYTEEDDTVHWNLKQPAKPVETPMLRMHFGTSSPGQEVKLRQDYVYGITAMEIDGTPVNYASTYSIAEPGNHTAVYQFKSSKIHEGLFNSESGEFDTFTSAEIISAVTEIGYNAFNRCGGLTGVSMSDSVTYIGTGAFSNCPSLQSVVLSDNLTSIWVGAFIGCTALASIDIPDSVTTIAFQAFAYTGLRSVTIPDSVTELSEQCFARCGDLRSAVIGSGVTTVGEKAFSGCGGLTEIYFNSVTPPTLGANALDNTNNCPIYVPAASVDTYKEAWPAYAARIKTKHRISASVNDDSLGVVNVQETASEGDHIDFDVEVSDMMQHQVLSVTVTDGNGNEVECNEDWDNHYSFDMPASDVTISVTIGEKQKHTVTVDSTDGMVGGFEFMSDDGQPSYKEGEPAAFYFNFDGQDGMFQLVSVQAIDCDGNSIEVELEDQGEGRYRCSFEMPGCDVSVFITVEDTRPKYNITASVNDSSLGEVHLDKEALHEGELADIHIDVFNSEANSVTSVTVTDGNGNNVECTKDYWDFSHYYFTMPASDVTVSVEIGDKIPEYNITVALNDDSLGTTRVSRTPLPEGEYGGFNVNLNDEEQYQISSVTVTDGNGNNVEWTTYVDATHTHYYHFKMPASDVSISVVIEPKQ